MFNNLMQQSKNSFYFDKILKRRKKAFNMMYIKLLQVSINFYAFFF